MDLLDEASVPRHGVREESTRHDLAAEGPVPVSKELDDDRSIHREYRMGSVGLHCSERHRTNDMPVRTRSWEHIPVEEALCSANGSEDAEVEGDLGAVSPGNRRKGPHFRVRSAR